MLSLRFVDLADAREEDVVVVVGTTSDILSCKRAARCCCSRPITFLGDFVAKSVLVQRNLANLASCRYYQMRDLLLLYVVFFPLSIFFD